MTGFSWVHWAAATSPIVLVLSIIVITHTLFAYWTAHKTAPQEILSLINMLAFLTEENESVVHDISKLQRLEDRLRLARALREIQTHSDSLQQQMDQLVVDKSAVSLPIRTRVLWALRRAQLEDRVRRLDLLRMRFLVMYLGAVTCIINKNPPTPPPLPQSISGRLSLKESLANDASENRLARSLPAWEVTVASKSAWAGVVEELQASPRMQQRHASVEKIVSK